MENGTITDAEISASSVYDSSTGASTARLNFIPTAGVSGGWVAADDDDDKPTLAITFSYQFTRVTRIATQGRQDANQWVKNYRLKYIKPNGDRGFYKDQGETLHKVNNNLMGSLRDWREWVRARIFLRRSRERNSRHSTRLLPILLATYAAFCTRVRDRSSRGYPLPPATQAILWVPQVFIQAKWRIRPEAYLAFFCSMKRQEYL